MAGRWRSLDVERLWLGARRYAGALWACFKFLILYPCIRPEKTNRFAFGALGLQDDLDYRHPSVPVREEHDVFPGIGEVDVTIGRMLPDEGSSVSFREMVLLCAIVRIEKARRVFEIGTSMGVTAYNIASNLPEDGVLYTLDLPPVAGRPEMHTHYGVSISDRKMIFADRERRRFQGSAAEPRIRQLYGDSATFDYASYKGTCDIVFVDGAHTYDYVKSDTRAAFELVKPGGLVIWHDYTDGHFWPDVHAFLSGLSGSRSVQRLRGSMLAFSRAGPERPA